MLSLDLIKWIYGLVLRSWIYLQ